MRVADRYRRGCVDTIAYASGLCSGVPLESRAIACSRAFRSISGKGFPRFSARRIIPSQALALKEYLCGVRASKNSDKEDAPAALRDRPEESTRRPVAYSAELRIEYSPRQTVPEFIQLRE